MEKPLVLIADDNDATCALVTAILRREFDVEVAGDGSEAIEKLRVRQYASILLDLRMPHVDGFTVLQCLADERPELLQRVIVLTAAVTKSELERVRTFPICDIIRKPFEVETLLEAVKHCATRGNHALPRGPLLSSGVILLLADLLRQRWL